MTLAGWRDLAIVFLAVQIFVVCLLPGVVTFFSIRGVLWAQRQARQYGPLALDKFQQAARLAETGSQKVAAPVLASSAALARVQRMRAAVISSLSLREV